MLVATEAAGEGINLQWQPIVKIDHYHVGADVILQQGMKNEEIYGGIV